VVGAALLVNVWPIVKLMRATDGARSRAVRSRLSVYRGFVVVQVAVTLALVTMAAMLGRSLQHVYGRDPGFAIDHTMVASLGVGSGTDSSPQSVIAATQDVLTGVRAVPGVRVVAAAYDHPLAANWIESYRITGDASGSSSPARQAELRVVTPTYFEAVRTALTDGRVLSDHDSWQSAGVAVVNESLARDIGGLAIGRRIETGTPARNWPGAPTSFEIVGVIEDERFHGLEEPSRPAMYLSTWQFPQAYVQLLVRTEPDPLAVAPAVRDAIRRLRGSATLDRATSLERILASQLLTRRVTTGVVTTFGFLALVLAAIGLYGLVAVSTTDRRREMAIRAALGATRSSVVGAVMWDGLRSTLIGAVAGIAIAIAAGPLIASQLVDIPSGDPVTLIAATLVLFGVTLVATVVPALLASRINLSQTLRADG
jgi:predicted permease